MHPWRVQIQSRMNSSALCAMSTLLLKCPWTPRRPWSPDLLSLRRCGFRIACVSSASREPLRFSGDGVPAARTRFAGTQQAPRAPAHRLLKRRADARRIGARADSTGGMPPSGLGSFPLDFSPILNQTHFRAQDLGPADRRSQLRRGPPVHGGPAERSRRSCAARYDAGSDVLFQSVRNGSAAHADRRDGPLTLGRFSKGWEPTRGSSAT